MIFEVENYLKDTKFFVSDEKNYLAMITTAMCHNQVWLIPCKISYPSNSEILCMEMVYSKIVQLHNGQRHSTIILILDKS